MAYSKNVFINCPFDDDYYPLLKAILFSTIVCGLKPQISETTDGDDIRIRQIQTLISKSKYSIHDISRVVPKKKGDLPRFNMPLELGIDLGCKAYLKKDKKFLVLEEEPWRYKTVISDISGQDISVHNNDPILVIKSVRDWFYKLKITPKPLAYMLIADFYNEFLYDFSVDMKNLGMDPDAMWEIPFSELIEIIQSWVAHKGIIRT